MYRNTQWSAAQKGVLTDMLSEHDFKWYSVYLLYWYKSTNTDAVAAASGPREIGLCAAPR